MKQIEDSPPSEKEWTSWTKCVKGSTNRERENPDSKLEKEFEWKLCSKGFPKPQPRADVGDIRGV